MQKLKSVKGTKDLYGSASELNNHLINLARNLASRYNCSEIITPILEHTEIFARTLGDASDIVSKEMYTFSDRSGEQLTLRPEFTAGIMRAVLTSELKQQLPLRFFCHGPIFRYERPQAGRQRQFQQINVEFIGEDTPYSDAECIKLAADIITACQLKGNTTLQINSIGCSVSRASYTAHLKQYFSENLSRLSELSKNRLQKNPLRILDSKEEEDLPIISNAPLISDYYSTETKLYFDQVLRYLDLLQVPYMINPRLVRGLDYYSHTTFEFINDAVGAQSAILAGGRYNDLPKALGGKVSIPSIGFGAGVERLTLATHLTALASGAVMVCPISNAERDHCIALSAHLRAMGLRTILSAEGKIAKRIASALRCNTKFMVFVGDEELAHNLYKLRDLDNHSEQLLTREKLLDILRSQL